MVYNSATYESYFKFAFVRNPWDRLLSAYRFMLAGGWHDGDRRWAARHLARHPSFEAFVLEGLTPEVVAGLHFQPQIGFLADPFTRRVGVDFVGQFETLQQDFRIVADRLGIRAELPHRNRSRADAGYRAAYTPAMVAAAAEVYARDVAAFGYDF